MKGKKTISVGRLDKLEHPTLEDILAVVNGGKYDKFFLKRYKEFSDGSREYLTKKGGKVYGRLVSILYAVARCTGIDENYNGGYTMEDVVEDLDDITKEEV
jgi:hypothetical protein